MHLHVIIPTIGIYLYGLTPSQFALLSNRHYGLQAIATHVHDYDSAMQDVQFLLLILRWYCSHSEEVS